MRAAALLALGLSNTPRAAAVLQLPTYLAAGKYIKKGHYNQCGKLLTPRMCQNPPKDRNIEAGLVVSTFMEDISWLNDMYFEGPIIVYVHDRSRGRSHNSKDSFGDDVDIAERSEVDVRTKNPNRKFPVQFETIPNKGDEAAAYLSYIVRKYNRLPNVTFFVQGHRCAAHAEFDMAKALPSIRECFPLAKGYMDLNRYNKKKGPEHKQCGKMEWLLEHPVRGFKIQHLDKLWAALFQEHLGELPARICWDSYAQFGVTRERIRARPLDLYKKLLRGVMLGNTTMEFFWKMLFLPTASAKPDHTEENYNNMVEWVMQQRR